MRKIVDIETMVFESPKLEKRWNEAPVQHPYSKYPESGQIDTLWRTWGHFAVKITCDDGTYGYGSTGTYNVCHELINTFFKPLLMGKNPFEIERIWDLMFSGSVGFGRRGATLMAISAIDIALWEILGKSLKTPVYQLLGGKVRDKIPCYGTGPHVQQHKEKGYFGSKIPMPYGPEHGKEGMRKNEARVREVREIMGKDGDIMCDCWCGWDYTYTIKMAERLKDYDIKWIEEALMPDDIEGFKRLRKVLNQMGILVTTGEHEHSRWGARELIDNGCVDILQSDIEYVGGVSELKKIMTYASVHGVTVIPHCPSVPGMHVAFNSTVSPFMERITHGFEEPMFITDYIEKDGYVELSDSPGYGVELNPKFTKRIA
jgi:L-rhamnonate dehydratase